jgi:hypothetical protein
MVIVHVLQTLLLRNSYAEIAALELVETALHIGTTGAPDPRVVALGLLVSAVSTPKELLPSETETQLHRVHA